MREFTKAELLHYNGSSAAPTFVAYEGKVYDVSASFLWKGGNHQVLHQAGQDFTEALKDAPHGPELLERFPVIGTLNEK